VDLSRLLAGSGRRPGAARRRVRPARGPDHALDDRLWALAREALERGEKAVMNLPIHTADRSVGAFLSGAVVRQCGGAGLPDDTIIGRFTGSAGQSFGAFAARGVTLILKGEANDYVGKGLSGARLILKPFPGAAYDPSSAVIAGNVLLYGATSGEAFIQGRVGERFAVRNSGAVAVVEGVGDHGCEYMTGGRVVILGETGVNFAAGMSGGLAYVYDEARGFDGRCNLDMVDLEPVSDPEDREELQALIRRHAVLTGSRKAASILDRWGRSVSLFVKVFPMDYRRALGRMRRDDAAVEREEALHG